ncbi:hypothetical protein HCBG_03859 [Histoplasma capsulatum G186AR]|uniref:Uncharacterized protein n=1 Tax=Ajellomyces capsulatus (strain G186AR / H82 / ATCC MYA-2454 / RMSCC 2432) TaxID=447093 RepID=C0NL29_AJECG|nr:uncharacterized protein HCBG_03859 [Histoplasma capsulatum G186AR]EEH08570.1 hypothetical protein HCBG_03859 [Histoplasma capsulatum G186AR]
MSYGSWPDFLVITTRMRDIVETTMIGIGKATSSISVAASQAPMATSHKKKADKIQHQLKGTSPSLRGESRKEFSNVFWEKDLSSKIPADDSDKNNSEGTSSTPPANQESGYHIPSGQLVRRTARIHSSNDPRYSIRQHQILSTEDQSANGILSLTLIRFTKRHQD